MQMRPTRVLAVLVLALASATAWASFVPEPTAPVSYEGQQVVRFDVRRAEDRAKIERWTSARGLDVWARHPEWIDVRLPRSVAAVEDVPLRVMSNDLQQDIDAERASVLAAAGREMTAESFFDTYRSLDEFNQFLDLLATNYPDLVTKKTIGKTVEGRPINGVLIASANNTRKVGIVYNGGQHAREWISPMTNAYIANQLVSLYGKDDEVTKMVDEVEWTIFPVINADGYVYSWTTDRMWRKNRRLNEDSWFRCYGVDTNRNWAFHWNEGGASGDTCSETYRGPKSFSEPEVTALADYISAQGNVKGYADIHSYSQLWMSQWGWTTAEVPKDFTTQNDLSKCMLALAVAAIKATHGKVYGYGPSAKVIYVASGGADDWTYGARNVTWSYSVELRDTGRYGFVLPASEIVPTGQETFAAVRVMANYILTHI
ncbi:zinc carboxypeptidase superfamily protein [Acanthamoeba castellanii str. Neff]|uniref:Zinc carboxypeptidase superfamily protein n=1 Tax=Acanthamoeba castellanii (strain ATCC 30010 / Neff) TaxID=1257118 RepID=L8GX42_ACACF|nr:zinc carboxypeptidase superfamily protein [Acanthamoeba castellanii str. Neff]ELR17113.1 zinc carboxypeptidase superfamily protein [Acanthamoeba castellanii str. Neff]